MKIDENALAIAFKAYEDGFNGIPGMARNHTVALRTAIKAYIEAVLPEQPVSVDLEKCAQATRPFLDAICRLQRISIAKQILDAAGVKYHD